MTTDNPNHIPDNAFEQTQPTSQQPSAFDQEYAKATLEDKMALHRMQVEKKYGVTNNNTAQPTMADRAQAQEASTITQYEDGSMRVAKGTLGNDKASAELIRILREQAYQRHNITD